MLTIRQFTFNPIQENTYVVFDEMESEMDKKEETDIRKTDKEETDRGRMDEKEMDSEERDKTEADKEKRDKEKRDKEKIDMDKTECLIIDPGCYFENERHELTNFIDKNRLVPKYLLNTHCHLDHIFGNKFVAAKYGLKVHIHPKEKAVFDKGPESGARWGFPFENYAGELVYLQEGADVILDDYRFKVLFTPGHSPGSVSFYCREEKIVIAGDVLFRQGIGRTDLPGGDYDTLISSIREQLFALPDDVTVYSGHGPATTIGYEKINNPFLI